MSRPRVVQKLGGTSLATVELVMRAAARAVRAQQAGSDVVLVVSAMAGETDRLLALARSVTLGAQEQSAHRPAFDVVAAAGEQVSAGLMTIALQALGAAARPLLGHQLPIRTDGVFGDAQIIEVGTGPVLAALEASEIPVVAGFQGIDATGAITTLGRGGSDTTAVAIAAALDAACEIYTDVDGVHSIDPRISDAAERFDVLGYRTMCALAAAGAKVLEPRSAALARRGGVRLQVRSSFDDGRGTSIVDDTDPRASGAVGVAIAKSAQNTGRVEHVEVSVIGAPVASFHLGRAEARLARSRIRLAAARETPDGHVFVVAAEDAASAARLLHALYRSEEDHALPWRRAHGAGVQEAPAE